MVLPPGTMINGYRILREVGRGGMAVVYHAFQENLGRDVALKLLPGALILDPDLLARFQHEARAVASLHHPAILVIHDVGAYHEQPYLVTEFIDGGTLARYLGTPQSLATVLRLLGPIAGALDYAHAQGLLHRDVKPTNILLRRDGRPVLADFGLAVAAEAEQRLTRTGLIMGTPEYMAPEQATQPSSALTAAVDRYALAVIAYELFTSRLPFGGATPVAMVMAHMTQLPPSPRTLNPEIPLWVEAVLLHGLAKDPNQRYPSATAFVEALAAGDQLGASPIPNADLPLTVAANEAVVSQVSSGPFAPSGMNATVAAQAPWVHAAPGAPAAALQPTKVVQPAPKGHRRLVAAAAFGLVAGLTAIVIAFYAMRGGGGHAAVLPLVTATHVPTATAPAMMNVGVIDVRTATAQPTISIPSQSATATKVPPRVTKTPIGGATATPKPPTPYPTYTALPTYTSVPTATLPPILAPQLRWISEISGTTDNLQGIECPSSTLCLAVGDDGTILTSADAGVSWDSSFSSTAVILITVNCLSSRVCLAVGQNGAIVLSADGGATWHSQSSGTTTELDGISCPGATRCLVMGGSDQIGTILAGTDGGASWSNQTSGTTAWLSDVKCPSITQCLAVGHSGTILTSADGGVTWSSRISGTKDWLIGISCPSAAICTVVGEQGIILTTADGGATWSDQASGTARSLFGISCPSTLHCTAVGEKGTILSTTDGGTAWSSQLSGTTKDLNGVSCLGAGNVCLVVGDRGTILAAG